MTSQKNITLREYLHLQARRVKNPPCIEVYDEFLIKVWDFFSLRVAAETYYRDNRHVALSRRGALPVSWELLRTTWNTGGPPEQTITLIAKTNANDINSLLSNLRKVLNRVRQKVPLGRVQQVDSHCLRWLTRQPGCSAAEKGGARQEILGVVRVENYNTLENRVLKDFLSRCLALATLYLRHYETKEYQDHVNIKAVRRLKNLCLRGLQTQELEGVSAIHEFPQPNYVLQQDRLYAKIWQAYCDILRQEDVAEKLWEQKAEVDDLYQRCLDGINLHCSPKAKYNTPLWINELDGVKPILENPIWKNEWAEFDVEEPDVQASEIMCGEAAIVDLSLPWDGRDVVVYPTAHRNARPFIQNPHRPSLEPGTTKTLREVLRCRDAVALSDYLRQLYGLLKKGRWVVLVPDHWEPEWLEAVLRARPSVMPRDRMFLLWRSVAAALGQSFFNRFKVGDALVIGDGYAVPFYNAICIRFREEKKTGRILPQRSSVRLHGGKKVTGERRFNLKCGYRDQAALFELGDAKSPRMLVGCLSRATIGLSESWVKYTERDSVLYAGVRRFLDEHHRGLVSYFDERDALSLVVQTRSEEVEFKILVEHEECSPGGTPYHGPWTRGGALQQGAAKFSLNLLEGEQVDHVPLKTLEEELDCKIAETQDFYFEAEVTPGQGLATVLFKAGFLQKPLPLDLTRLQTSGMTKARIEREMKRHFPPVMPFVEASPAIWDAVRHETWLYLQKGTPPAKTDLFAKAQPYWGTVDPTGQLSFRLFGMERRFDEETMSPIDRLKRENVFGNAPGYEFPVNDFDWDRLFGKLASDYQNGKNVLRMIAWTYQYQNDVFEFIREALYKKYVRQAGSLTTVEYTFCANCFDGADKRIAGILRHVLERIVSKESMQEEYRLTYNLLQFHPTALKNIESGLCEQAFMRIYRTYNTYPFLDGRGYWQKGATKMAGYLLKCMLFLLHRRRFDAEFLKRNENWQPNGRLAQPLPTHTPTLIGHEKMRVSFLNYVRGHGTIEGIPLGD